MHWVASAKRDLKRMPDDVQDAVGAALREAQRGFTPDSAKPLRGFSGAGVLEIIEDHDGSTYRAVYTVRFAQAIYVLHVFQKRSKRGIATPKQEIEVVRRRLAAAEADYRRWLQDREG